MGETWRPDRDEGTGSRALAATQTLERVLKSYALYEGKGPLCESALAQFCRTVRDTAGERPRLPLQVRPDALAIDGVAVSRDEVAFIAFQTFRDGLRSIEIDAAIDLAELHALCCILADPLQRWGRPSTSSSEPAQRTARDQDTATRLWEADFAHVWFTAVDAYIEREVLIEGDDHPTSIAELIRRGAAAYAPPLEAPSQRGGSVAVVAAIEAGHGTDLDRTERAAWRTAALDDHALAVIRSAVLLVPVDERPRSERSAAWVGLLVRVFQAASWPGLTLALGVLDACADAKPLAEEVHRAWTEEAYCVMLDEQLYGVGAEGLEPVVRSLRALGFDPAARASAVFAQRHDPALNRALESVLDRFGCGVAPLFRSFLEGDEARALYAVTELSRLMARSAPDPWARMLVRLGLKHASSKVRLGSFQLLQGDRDPATIAALCRTLAVNDRALLTHASAELRSLFWDPKVLAETEAAVLAAVESVDFWGRPAPARRVVMELLCAVPSGAAVKWIESYLGRKAFVFGRKQLEEQQEFIRRAQAAVQTMTEAEA